VAYWVISFVENEFLEFLSMTDIRSADGRLKVNLNQTEKILKVSGTHSLSINLCYTT